MAHPGAARIPPALVVARRDGAIDWRVAARVSLVRAAAGRDGMAPLRWWAGVRNPVSALHDDGPSRQLPSSEMGLARARFRGHRVGWRGGDQSPAHLDWSGALWDGTRRTARLAFAGDGDPRDARLHHSHLDPPARGHRPDRPPDHG